MSCLRCEWIVVEVGVERSANKRPVQRPKAKQKAIKGENGICFSVFTNDNPKNTMVVNNTPNKKEENMIYFVSTADAFL